MVQRGLPGNEFQCHELGAGSGQLRLTEVQSARQCGAGVVAQPLTVGDGHEKQVQRCTLAGSAVNQVVLYQLLVNPAKLFGRVAYVIRAQRLFDDLHGDGSG